MKSLQSIIQGGGSRLTSPPATLSAYAKKDDVSRHTPNSTSNDEQALWQDCFLPKSSTFLKALRRSGRRGKVLIQGWAAFRENSTNLPSPSSWKEIIRNPQRFDFRYIILLDDMPTLHIFSSRQKQKKKKMVVSAMQTTKHDVLRDCIHLNLTSTSNEDLAVRINLVSKELGNEVASLKRKRVPNVTVSCPFLYHRMSLLISTDRD